MKIGVKLTLAFFTIASVSMLVIGIISYRKGKQALEEESFNRLTAVREMKANQIEDYFSQIKDQVVSFSHDPTVVRAMKRFKNGFNEYKEDGTKDAKKTAVAGYIKKEFLPRLNRNSDKPVGIDQELCNDEKGVLLQYDYIVANPNPAGKKQEMLSPADTSAYSKAHARFHPFFKEYQEQFGFYDIFLVDNKTGNIVYTVFKEVDFGTSLHNGPYKNTNLADAFRHADYSNEKNQAQFEDFQPYHPSYNSPASFIAAPIIDSGQKIGVLIFQMPIDRINDVMTSKHNWEGMGLGKSGETYIVGEDHTLRSQSRFFIEDSAGYFAMLKEIGIPAATISKMKNFKSTIGLQEVKTEGVKEALEGKTDTRIFNDYRDLPVLSSFKPLKIEGVKWVIMSELDEEEAFSHVYALRRNVIIFSSCMGIFILLMSYIISRHITRPIKELTYDAKQLRKGNFDVEINIQQKDEIGELAQSFRKMQQSMRRLIYDLKDINHNLEEKVTERTKEIQHQKEMVEHKNKEIVDSINYALRLQQAILPPKSFVEKYLPDSFIFYKPKDIVAGDFYWVEFSPLDEGDNEEILVAAADCTGHGVPGAMVSVVGSNGLERCLKEFKLHRPADILDKLTDLVIATFETSDHEVKDGMDISLVAFDNKTKILQYAGANNPLWIVRKEPEGVTLIEIKADKQPIGKFDFRKPFTNHTIHMQKGDCVYMFTDGYADQFGGPQGKKFKYKTLKDLLLSIHDKNMQEQMIMIEEAFMGWKADYEQVDDVCIIGFRL